MKRLVIVGGGYFGVDAYRAVLREAGREVRSGEIQMTVVSMGEHHAFHGWTGEVLGGIVAPAHMLTSLVGLLPRASFVHGRVVSADLVARKVTVHLPDDTECVLPFDRLLLGTGSRDALECLAGVREHGWCLKTPGDLHAFRAKLHAELRADQLGRPALRVAVIGGGFAGVEMAAAIAELGRARGGREVQVHLIGSGERLLNELRPRYARLAEYAERELRALGVELHLGPRATAVTADGVRLASGAVVASDLTLFTAGVAFDVLPGTLDLPRDEQGRLVTDEFLRVSGRDDVFAGGDAAVVARPSGGVCPTNALWAMKHGMWAGANAARSIQGRPLRRFSYGGLGQAASVGVGRGVTELKGVQFTGLPGWVLRLGFFAWYMPSRRQSVRVLRDWWQLAARGRRLDGEGTLNNSGVKPRSAPALLRGERRGPGRVEQ
ncbi:NAD(P)/FAD-dependent oxidoreductase [Deinococcus aquatilis]|uniref:NAD(P)/FAD-dependent oxidoreductase n=1 Tax=Deinococcus aquatilis TaxID=519440 RepID=UPI00037F5DCD|nr:FAD-dependent oxidoreductase [Deinococcus aquatilis]